MHKRLQLETLTVHIIFGDAAVYTSGHIGVADSTGDFSRFVLRQHTVERVLDETGGSLTLERLVSHVQEVGSRFVII
ncbi:hypothetical protein D3C75_813310 [compost metagenome]